MEEDTKTHEKRKKGDPNAMKELDDRGGRAVDSLRRVCICQHTSAYISMHTSAYVSIRSDVGVQLTRFVGSA